LHSHWVKFFSAIPIFLFLIYSHYRNKESLEDIGFSLKNWRDSFKILFIFTSISIPILYVAWQFFLPVNNFFYNDYAFWKRLAVYPFVVLGQGYIFLAFFFRRFRQLFFPHTNIAIVFSALIFSIIHIPTPPLIILCFIAGIVWASVYQKYPNLFTITIFHSILGIFCSFVLLIYSEVGPDADPGKWSKNQDTVHGYIDNVNHMPPFKNKDSLDVEVDYKQNSIFVAGWVASEDKINSVQLSLGGKNYPVRHDIERKDVAAHYNNPNYLYSGFSANIPISDFALGYHKLLLKVDVEGDMFYHSPGSRVWINLK
jgi:membrane protease YdiL (CAAX protease family)